MVLNYIIINQLSLIKRQVTIFLEQIHIKLNSQINRGETTPETLKTPVLIFTKVRIELKPKQVKPMASLRSRRVHQN